MRLFDTHCHLTEEPLASDLRGVLARAREAGVEEVLVPASGRASWGAVTAMRDLPGVHTAIGLHPWFAQEGVDKVELEDVLARHSCVAIGEIGLDLAVDSPPADVQIRVLETQLSVACDMDLPVLLHCRKAFTEPTDVLKSYLPGLRGLLHAFSRSPEVAKRSTFPCSPASRSPPPVSSPGCSWSPRPCNPPALTPLHHPSLSSP